MTGKHWHLLLSTFVVAVFAVSANPGFAQSHRNRNNEAAFDFIVLGGGTGGCAVAGRLSENGKHSVLLLERGGEPPAELEVPALSSTMLNNPNVSRIYTSIPHTNAAQSTGGITYFLTASTLGGASSINGMFFNRGSPEDYNNWARITGDRSWRYSNLLRLFRKMETYAGLFPSDQHGNSGPIYLSRPRYAPGMNDTLTAGRFLGYPVADQNGPQINSYTPVEKSIRFGRRVSSYTAYIQPFLQSRRNLQVIRGAEVSRIVFNGNRAIGVIYNANGTGEAFVRVRKEVVVSAGVLNSPVILMKSGIGPRDVLEPARIPTVKSLPVGLNLQDHFIAILTFLIRNTSDVFIPERDLTPSTFQQWQQFGDGPYTNYDGISVQAFLSSPRQAVNDGGIGGWADTHLVFMHSSVLPAIPGVGDSIQGQVGEGEVAIGAGSFVTRPRSRGRITLNTTNVNADPILDFRFLSDPRDIEVILHGIKVILQTYEGTPQYQRHGARLIPTPNPACTQHSFRSDDYWRCVIRQIATSGVHAGGTCKMSHSRDPTAVVDSQLRVIGIDNVRVADASAMPAVVNANTQVGVYVIAEKVAEDILQRWEAPNWTSKTSYEGPGSYANFYKRF